MSGSGKFIGCFLRESGNLVSNECTRRSSFFSWTLYCLITAASWSIPSPIFLFSLYSSYSVRPGALICSVSFWIREFRFSSIALTSDSAGHSKTRLSILWICCSTFSSQSLRAVSSLIGETPCGNSYVESTLAWSWLTLSLSAFKNDWLASGVLGKAEESIRYIRFLTAFFKFPMSSSCASENEF